MEPRQCFVILNDQFHPERGYVPSLVTENQPGHAPLVGRDELARPWFWGRTLEEAEATCERVNRETFGLEPDETLQIVISSIAAQNRREADERRARHDYDKKLGRLVEDAP